VERTQVWITDASADALAVARSNLAGIGRAATRVSAVEGSWFEALPEELHGTIDLIVSNPPYVAISDEVEDVVRDWEPMSALFAGDDGLNDIRKIVTGAATWLRPSGTLVLEMAPDQISVVSEMALAGGFDTADSHADLTGRLRAVVARVGG
jgi:release factor glutamine methyltransferase